MEKFKILYADWLIYRIAQQGGFADFVLEKTDLKVADFDEMNDIYRYAHICNLWWMRERAVGGFYDIETNPDFFAAATGGTIPFPGSSSHFFTALRIEIMNRFAGFKTGIDNDSIVRVLPHPLYGIDFIVVLQSGAKTNGEPLRNKKRENIDADCNFEHIADRWYRDSTSIYSLTDHGNRCSFVKIKKANAAEFKVLNEYYAYDGNYIFYVTGRAFKRGGGIPEILPTNLHTIFGDRIKLQDSLLARDESKVYFGGKEIKNASSKNYRQIDYDYFTDGKKVFYGNIEVEGADPDSFIVISERTATDRTRGYFGALPAHPENDRHSFEAFFKNSPFKDYWYFKA